MANKMKLPKLPSAGIAHTIAGIMAQAQKNSKVPKGSKLKFKGGKY